MTYYSATRRALSFVAALLLYSSAHAQLFRAYLASDGLDTNPCTLAQPCRLLPAALAAVTSGGEIWMLDSANYNIATVNIGKSVSILAVPGAVGSVVAVGGPAISIAASLQVALRNLVIVPLPGGGGTHGVVMAGASVLTIEHTLIANLPNTGVLATGAGTLKITETIIRNNDVAVQIVDGATGTISQTQILANADGVLASTNTATTTKLSVSDSIISGGGGEGVFASTSIVGAVTKIYVTRSTIEGTSWALDSETIGGFGSSLITVSYSMITNNSNGWYQSGTGSVVRSLGNNHFDNGTSLGSLTQTSLQ